jgi:hypothetical protein
MITLRLCLYKRADETSSVLSPALRSYHITKSLYSGYHRNAEMFDVDYTQCYVTSYNETGDAVRMPVRLSDNKHIKILGQQLLLFGCFERKQICRT